MRKQKILILIIFVSTLLPITAFSQIYTIGPTINWNFGSKQCKVSGGLELGIIGLPIEYNDNNGGVLSMELGLDFEKKPQPIIYRNQIYTI